MPQGQNAPSCTDVDAAPLGSGEGFLGAQRDASPLLFRKRCLQMQHEPVFRGLIGSNEQHVGFKQAADEVNIAGESVELRDYQCRPLPPAQIQVLSATPADCSPFFLTPFP